MCFCGGKTYLVAWCVCVAVAGHSWLPYLHYLSVIHLSLCSSPLVSTILSFSLSSLPSVQLSPPPLCSLFCSVSPSHHLGYLASSLAVLILYIHTSTSHLLAACLVHRTHLFAHPPPIIYNPPLPRASSVSLPTYQLLLDVVCMTHNGTTIPSPTTTPTER